MSMPIQHKLSQFKTVLGMALLACASFAPISYANEKDVLEPTPVLQYAALADDHYDPTVFPPSDVSDKAADRIFDAWRTEAPSMPWTSLMLNMIVKHKIAPTRAARGSALVHVAMHDAYLLSGDPVTRKIAVSTAASQVLGYWFASEEHGFDRILGRLLKRMEAESQRAANDSSATNSPQKITSEQRQRGLQLGRKVGLGVIARAQSDGAERGWNGVRLQWYGDQRFYGPGSWEPTKPYFYYPPDEPFAPGWKTWVVQPANQFRPQPPAFGSARFLKDLQEVIDIQKKITPEQIKIAKFWVDGSGSVTPPGHWNQIGLDLARKHHLGEAQTVQMFAVLNITLADTFIAVWDTKYHYWTGRPVTLAKAVLGVDMTPVILTPPFPSYVSGHAAFSGAGARVLGAYFPEQAASLDAMAEEAAMSRLYGGIHYRHDNDDGLALGRKVSEMVLKKMWR